MTEPREEIEIPVNMICKTCRSHLVLRDAVVGWSIPDQDWVIVAVTQSSYCAACDADDAMIEVGLHPL